ncbi:MAG: tetratricopeptide repeat protein [Acidobacteriota bacterium]|nr:tetratricopeptide repeat protein [Acidobacteriota bacterium]
MKNKTYYTSIFVFALIFSFVGLTEIKAQQGYGDRIRGGETGSISILGKVLLPNGQPAVGVKVSINGADFTSGSAQTDGDGGFRFNSLPAGNYNISIKGGEEFESENESLTIDQGASSGHNFNLVFYLRTKGTKKIANPMLAAVPKEPLEKYNSAVEKIKGSDYKAAVSLLDEAIKIYPNFAAAYYEEGLVFLKQNDLDKALESFSKAIQAKPDYLDAKLNYAFTLLSMKDFKDAGMVLQDVIKQKSDSPMAYSYLGIALIGIGKTNEAEAAFKKSLSLPNGENLAPTHRYLGGIYMQKKQNKEAIAELKKYLDLLPKAPDADKIKTMINDLKKQEN